MIGLGVLTTYGFNLAGPMRIPHFPLYRKFLFNSSLEKNNKKYFLIYYILFTNLEKDMNPTLKSFVDSVIIQVRIFRWLVCNDVFVILIYLFHYKRKSYLTLSLAIFLNLLVQPTWFFVWKAIMNHIIYLCRLGTQLYLLRIYRY